MSLFNQLLGVNPLSDVMLHLIGLSVQDISRFRDVFLVKEGEKVLLGVYARIGGGNRADYQECIDRLKAHPKFVREADDNLDETYANFYFEFPEEAAKAQPELVEILLKNGTPTERFDALLKKLKGGHADDPEVRNALEVGKKIFEGLEKAKPGEVTIIET
jgi:hypothetical protein